MKLTFNKSCIIWIVVAAIIVTGITLGLVFGLKNNNQITAAVVSNGRDCAAIGTDMLSDGGSAVDAAIATLLCESVLLPHSMGMGGGFVATIYTKRTGKVETLIAREAAPAAAYRDMFLNETTITGARAGGVPGEMLGYYEMHRKYGRLPWSRLFSPTIKLCLDGHYVSKYLAGAIAAREDRIRNEPSLAEVFLKEDGTKYVEGDTMRRPVLGVTLQRLANFGINELYGGGELGKMFAEDIQEMGGIITEQDLQDYRVRWEDDNHIMANITGGYTLYTTPLPSSGALLAFIMNVMNDLYTKDENILWQRTIETFKHAYGLRTNLGDYTKDPEMAETIQETLDKLTSVEFAKDIRNLIFDNQTFTNYSYYGANFTNVEDHGTANMAVIAPNGDAVSITSTINTYFGAKVRSRRTGIILNDEMDDFSTPGLINAFGIPASPANYIQPGKIPMSSMCPALILDKDGNVRMLVGAAGGSKITTAVALAIIKYLVLSDSLDSAINGGRVHHQLAPMRVDLEATVPESIQTFLKEIGHELQVANDAGFAAVTAIGVRDGKPEPVYDHRRVGSVSTVQNRNKMYH